MREMREMSEMSEICDTSLEKDCIMKRKYYSCIYRVSFLSFLSSIYAIYCDCYDLAIVPGGVFLTSVNYWRRPTYGWRRNLDMGYVASALIYQNYHAYHAYHAYYYMMNLDQSFALLYLALMLFSIGCYPVSVYLYKKKDIWGSTYVHCLLHVVANIANVVLYNGLGGIRGGGGDRDRNPPSGSAAPFCPCSDAPFLW
jgi:hypothetical protein